MQRIGELRREKEEKGGIFIYTKIGE